MMQAAFQYFPSTQPSGPEEPEEGGAEGTW